MRLTLGNSSEGASCFLQQSGLDTQSAPLWRAGHIRFQSISIRLRWLPVRCLSQACGFLQYLHSNTSTNSGCARANHLLGLPIISDSASSLYSHVAADHAAHQRNVGSGGASLAESRRGLDEISARLLGN